MQIRDRKPEANNPFYNTLSRGGFSECIKGFPTDSDCDVLSNCVGYACGRFNEIIGYMKYPHFYCNAENFIERAKDYGLEISTRPSLGGIMVFQKGLSLHGGDGAGHVFIVEKILNDKEIITSESAYGGTAFYTKHRININNKWGMNEDYYFRGCIVNPKIGLVTYKEETDLDLARKVIAGEFGNGEERKRLLGDKYDRIQSLVNEILQKPKDGELLLNLVKKTLRGDFGNGEERKRNLGASYNEVQRQINLNYENGTINNLRLY